MLNEKQGTFSEVDDNQNQDADNTELQSGRKENCCGHFPEIELLQDPDDCTKSIGGASSECTKLTSVVSGNTNKKTCVYRTRWYILAVVGLTTVLQDACWGTWGPIAQSAKAVYGWNTALLSVMINCGNVGVLTCLLCAGYIVNKKGLRVSILLATLTLALSPALRAITYEQPFATILVGAGQFLAGAAGSLTMVVPPVISETWFPIHERTTATAIAVLSNAVGGAAAFLLGPNLVSQPLIKDMAINETSNITFGDTIIIPSNTLLMKHQIRRLNLIETGFGTCLFIMALVYFPRKPMEPPSVTASLKRQPYREGFTILLRNPNVWRVTTICAIPFAIFVNWLGLLNVNFNHLGITQTQTGWYGFYALITGSVGGTIIGRIADKCRRRLKLILILMFVFGLGMVVWIICMRTIYRGHSQALAAAIAILGVFLYTTFPLNIELACEIGYPVAEETIGTFLALIINVAAVFFLLIQTIPGVGVNWMNWTFLGLLVLPIISLFTFNATYHRMDIDLEIKVEASSA